MMSAFQKFAITWLASIAVAFMFFYYFQTNTAAVDLNLGVKLGGPIAGAAAMLLITQHMLARYEKSQGEIDRTVRKALSERLQPILGEWVAYADSTQSDRKAISETRFEEDEGRLVLKGGVFRSRDNSGAPSAYVGDWNCDIVAFDGDRLAYLYTLVDKSAAENEIWRGFVEARLVTSEAGDVFEGRWEVFGRDHHEGKITLKRA
ncbi:MAG: hypothetical protein AAGF94_05395 [Pseudomonadota bacterium]